LRVSIGGFLATYFEGYSGLYQRENSKARKCSLRFSTKNTAFSSRGANASGRVDKKFFSKKLAAD